ALDLRAQADAAADADHDRAYGHQHAEPDEHVAIAGVERPDAGPPDVLDVPQHLEERALPADLPVAVDDGADPAAGRPNHGDAILDGAERRLGQMLVRRRRVAVPGVVGDVDAELGSAIHEPARQRGEDALVADEGAEAAVARQVEHGRHDAGAELPDRRHDLADEEEHAREGDVLAEGHELHLVVGADFAPLRVDQVDAVQLLEASRIGLPEGGTPEDDGHADLARQL